MQTFLHTLRWGSLWLLGCLLALSLPAQEHPRGLITPAELVEVRARLDRPPYRGWLAQLRDSAEALPARPAAGLSLYDRAFRAGELATLYLLSGEPGWATQAYTWLETVFTDSLYADPGGFGLTRALAVQQVAIVYDFCYAGWTAAQRQQVNAALFAGMAQVHTHMGFDANYSLASNWMGVRYGAVALASCVWDPPAGGGRNPALPYRWDAQKRLEDHLAAVIYAGGWHGESMGYFAYDWSFCAPALIALQNASAGRHFQLASWMPRLLPTMQGLAAAAVDIAATGDRRGLKPDLSDDNLTAMGAGGWALALRLYPPAQQPRLRAVFDYRFGGRPLPNGRMGLVHSLLFYPDSLPAAPLAPWTRYHDPEQGIVILRDRFQDSADVVFTLSATARRVQGHQGPDTHTWRLLGLGVPWVIGGGRTGETGLQTNFFPADSLTPAQSTGATGVLHSFTFPPGGGDFHSAGSCLGLPDHERHTQVRFDSLSGCRAVILMQEQATGGRRWRVQTPAFIGFEPQPDGYLLRAPDGASLRVHLLGPHGAVTTGLHRYGGDTQRHNYGIPWGGQAYAQSRWIDVACTDSLRVVMTLQEPGRPHPPVQLRPDGAVQVGERWLKGP